MKSNFFRHIVVAIAIYFTGSATVHAQSVNVLFIGNSYTEVNNLPQMTANIASSTGLTMNWNKNTPGGCTFNQHCTNQSMEMIVSGGWDYVVLQEQSQLPSFPQSQVETEVFPYATRLVDSVYAHKPCAEPMFYMTWGRKNGDLQNAIYFPVLGTYEGMDSMLCERYLFMAQSNDASVCPVGRVWHYLRDHHSEIELYQTDGSHPSIAGTYAAACAFFVMFFDVDPETVSYMPDGIDGDIGTTIRSAVKEVVYMQQQQWERPRPTASLEVVSSEGPQATFIAHTTHADSVIWHFGDNTTTVTDYADSTQSHLYYDSGNYVVTIVATRHCMHDTAIAIVTVAGDTLTTWIPIIDSEFSSFNSQGSLVAAPNPGRTAPTLLVDGKVITADDAEINVTDSYGRKVALSNDMPKGLYIITVKWRNNSEQSSADGNPKKPILTTKYVKF